MAETLKRIILDVATGEVEELTLTREERDLVAIQETEAEQDLAQELAKKEARSSARSKLAALGLTEEEIAAL